MNIATCGRTNEMTISSRNLRIAVVLLSLAQCVVAQTASSRIDVEKRVDSLVRKMTVGEKIEMIGGINDFNTRPISRLGIPSLRMSDGPMGVHDYGLTTAYPAGIALAASWDIELVQRFGTAMGKDARARGVHFILGPGMNIYRAPMCGRNFEYFGEDPFLASRMAVAVIRGIQGQRVIATAKHFAGNNSEFARMTLSSNIDERTLREIYLPAFEASVKEAKVGAVMDAYNLVNGVYMTQNNHLNNEILKKEWGFDGILMSDWGATHDGVSAAIGGLDLEMPSPTFMNSNTLLPALKEGKIPVATLDDKVTRILRKAIEFGFFDQPQTDIDIPSYSQEGRQVALEAARGIRATYFPWIRIRRRPLRSSVPMPIPPCRAEGAVLKPSRSTQSAIWKASATTWVPKQEFCTRSTPRLSMKSSRTPSLSPSPGARAD
jgi:beta-glucosidase